MKLHGVITALVTPFRDGKLDLSALEKLTLRQIEAGIHGLVALGSTGEAATISYDERAEVIRTVIGAAHGRTTVIVGAGTNDSRTSIQLVRQAKDLGADAAMLVTPYYNKPTPDGLLAHYEAVANSTDLPLLAYNVPGRTGLNLDPATAERIARLPAYIGLKEASGNVSQVAEIVRRTRSHWTLLSGEDALFLPILAVGGEGIICTTSNLVPERFVRLYEAWTAGNVSKARDEQLALLPLISAMFMASNPIPVKAALALLDLCTNELRLPLTPLNERQSAELISVMKNDSLL